ALLRPPGGSAGRQTQPLGAAALDPTPEDSLRRGGNDTETRTSTAHQRNIDRELIPPGDKLRGAVEGVDQDEAARDALRERASHRLLRHHAHPGKHAGESFEAHRLGCVIGGGDRGEIAALVRTASEPARAARRAAAAAETMVVSSSSSRPSTAMMSSSGRKRG